MAEYSSELRRLCAIEITTAAYHLLRFYSCGDSGPDRSPEEKTYRARGEMISASEVNRIAFFKRTRKGKVVRFVREKYRRSDVGFGSLHGKTLDEEALHAIVAESAHKTLLVVDTNIVLHELDLLEQQSPVTALIVVPQTVLQELRNQNFAAFKRLRSLMDSPTRTFIFYPNETSTDALCLRNADESANDFNDRAIVAAASVFHSAIESPARVVFLTNDVANRKRAVDAGLEAFDMRTFLNVFSAGELLEFTSSTSMPPSSNFSQQQQQHQELDQQSQLFPEHMSQPELQQGLRDRTIFRGVIRAARNQWDTCYVVVNEGGPGDRNAKGSRTVIKVEGSIQVNRALEGDIVAVQVLSQQPVVAVPSPQVWQVNEGEMVQTEAEPSIVAMEGVKDEGLQGKVVGVIRRGLKQCAGSLDAQTVQPSGDAYCVQFVPVDKRLPRVLLTTRRLTELLGKRLLVAIDSWPASSPLPLGHYVRTFGVTGDRAVENAVLLHELGVAHEEFSTAVLACLPAPDWKITAEEIAKRTDLRDLPIASVDPPGCKDIDDALHAIPLPNGNYQVGVHIADVSHFVLPDSAMDKEAALRCTSTYLVERRLDMLPELLTTRLCSLRAAEDHLTFSVLWEMDAHANIVNVQFCKSVIHSKAALSYAQAQDILDATPSSSDSATHTSLRILNTLARILRQRRIEAGALTLASPEVRFKLDEETQNPLDVALYQLREANSMVEEWMLLANITVAKKTLQHFPTLSVLRRHQPPSREQFAPLLQAAALAGVHLDISSSLALARSLDNANRPEDPFFNKLLRILSTRCMMPAQYLCSGELSKEDWHHYGLAAPVYTHFTSPIRRYADVLVHRLLAAAIGVAPLPNSTADRMRCQDQCSQMNRRHRAAQLAQRASVQLYTLIFFKERVCIEDAYVLSVSEEKMGVLVPRYGFEGALLLSDMQASLQAAEVVFLAERSAIQFNGLRSKRTTRTISIFDRIRVRISTLEGENNEHSLQLSLEKAD